MVGAIEPELEQAEIDRARRKPTRDLQAYDYYLRGMASLYVQVREATRRSPRVLSSMPPTSTPRSPYLLAQASPLLRAAQSVRLSVDHDQEMVEAERLARRALELNRKDPRVLASAGYSLAYVCGRLTRERT